MTDLQANLHNHSEHSHLDGYANVEAIATRAKELGQSAIALTDHGECSGHIAFYKACRRHDIHPILGTEGYWLNDIAQKKDSPNSHITLLAQNQQGLSNLWTLSSIAYQREYFYRKPLMDADLLRTYADGIYASDGCLMTDLSRAVVGGREDEARQYLANLHGIFRDRFYMELHTWQFMDPQTDDQRRLNGEMAAVNQAKVRFATEMGIPLVVVNDSHHARPEDWENKDLVWKFNTGNKNPDQLLQGEGQKADHIMGSEEIIGWMARHGVRRSIVEEAIRNSADIARACNVEIRPTLDLPRYSATDHDDMVAFLDLVEEGFRRKVEGGGLDVPTYFARMESESRLICDKGFCGYFLVVHDYVKAAKSGRWAQYVTDGKRQPIQVGAGRGSGGGSLVAWLLDITSIDPIRHNLLFERFLSPARQGYPDIDTDVPRSHRPNMRAYLEARYGHDHVCTIGTTIRNSPKGMVRDLGRAYGLSYTDTEAISKIIVEAAALVADEIEETGEEVSWEVVLAEKGGDLKPWVQSHPELFQRLGEMVGIARQSGVHPSGILVNNSPLMGKVPLRTRKHGKPDEVTTTQFSMDEVENDLGGVKFDLLGIRHLDTLDHFRDLVRERHGRDIDFDTLTEEELSDPILWGRIDQGRTTGIFQVETPGSTRVAKELHPRNVSDLAALVSIVRPGVKDAGLTDAFLRRRMGEEPVTYDHPLMEPIVSGTYGILVYQEQVMRASRDLALFSAEEADGLRKVTAKKKADEIGQWEDKFIDGCLANPAFSSVTDKPRAAAQRIWVSINASARYSFNKCAIGSTQVKLAASGPASKGFMTIGDMYRRLTDISRLEGEPCWYGCRHTGYRGQCQTCRVWRQKFRDPSRGLYSWSLGDDGRLHPNRIVDVHHNGIQPVWKVTLADGNTITTTENHRHMTPEGWREVNDLRVGDDLLVCGEYEQQVYDPAVNRTTSSAASYAGARLPNSLRQGVNSLGYRDGGFLALREWTERQDWVCSEIGCSRSKESGDRIERAHLDGDRRNNAPSNLAMKCASHHKQHDYRVNARRRRGDKGYPAVPTRIVSIEFAGKEEVYDLEMADPHHSWVANDIVTHNSHATAYALLSNWEVFAFAHYEPEMLVALMQTDPAAVPRYVREARRSGITVLPPDINLSGQKFTIVGDTIRYGIDTVRGVGPAAIKIILRARPFTSFEDYLARVSGFGVSKTVVVNLIILGAFDSLGDRRDLLLRYQRHRILASVSPNRLATLSPDELDALVAKKLTDKPDEWEIPIPDFSDPAVVGAIEEELLGSLVTVDPMAPYARALEATAISHPDEINQVPVGDTFDVGGQVTKVKEHTIQKQGRSFGRKMAFLSMSRNEEEFEVVAFPDTWDRVRALAVPGSPVLCRAKRTDRGATLEGIYRLDLLFDEAPA